MLTDEKRKINRLCSLAKADFNPAKLVELAMVNRPSTVTYSVLKHLAYTAICYYGMKGELSPYSIMNALLDRDVLKIVAAAYGEDVATKIETLNVTLTEQESSYSVTNLSPKYMGEIEKICGYKVPKFSFLPVASFGHYLVTKIETPWIAMCIRSGYGR